MKQTYEQRVRALAERMAAREYPKQVKRYKDNTERPHIWPEYVQKKIEDARIAVAEMAEAYEMGRAKGYELGIAWSEGKPITLTPKFELIEQSLIPDQEPPKESAFEKEMKGNVTEGGFVDWIYNDNNPEREDGEDE